MKGIKAFSTLAVMYILIFSTCVFGTYQTILNVLSWFHISQLIESLIYTICLVAYLYIFIVCRVRIDINRKHKRLFRFENRGGK